MPSGATARPPRRPAALAAAPAPENDEAEHHGWSPAVAAVGGA